jgi:AcrR family transcriptional regulator
LSDKKIGIPKQERSIQKKQLIITTALEIFARKGYFNTSSNEIAAQAGVSIGSFYAYFKDKKQLFLEVMDYYNELITNEIKPSGTLEDDNIEEYLFDLINSILQAHKIHPDFHQEIMAMYIADPDVRELIDKQKKIAKNHSLDYLKAGKKAWGKREKIKNLEVAAFIIDNTIEKIIHETVLSNTTIPEARIIKELANMILKYILCELPARRH